MKTIRRVLAAATAVAMLPTAAAVADHLENTLYIELEWGRVVVQMRPDLAPKHVAQIKRLARKGFYDGLIFHRVIDGFMVQGGDPRGDGTGGSGTNVPAEFSREKHVRGVTSMARSRNPDSADSQFFIMLGEAPYLDGKYTVWGKVIEGMNHVDKIKKGDPRSNGMVRDPSSLVRMQVASDVEKRSH